MGQSTFLMKVICPGGMSFLPGLFWSHRAPYSSDNMELPSHSRTTCQRNPVGTGEQWDEQEAKGHLGQRQIQA